MSTPFGTRGWWYEAWRSDEPWDRYKATADDLPHDWYKPSKEEFLRREKRRLGEWWYHQEFYCDFLDAQTQVFTREEVERMFKEDLEEWDWLPQ